MAMSISNDSPDLVCKLIIIGDVGVGKTSVVRRFTDNEFAHNFGVTVGIDFKIKQLQVRRKTVKLQIWDTASMDKYRSMTFSYYRDAKAIIIAYDITNRKTFDRIKYWIADLNKACGVIDEAEQILIGNKCDNEDCRAVETDEGEKLAECSGMQFCETSAKENVNINEVFMKLLDTIVAKETKRADDVRRRSERILLTTYNHQNNSKTKGNCC